MLQKIKRIYMLSVAMELLGICAVSVGVGYEIAYGADLGYIIICVGSALVAIGSVIFAKFRPWVERE